MLLAAFTLRCHLIPGVTRGRGGCDWPPVAANEKAAPGITIRSRATERPHCAVMAANLEDTNLDETDSFIDEDDVEELEEREEAVEEAARHRFELSDCKKPLTSFFITDILDPQKFKGRTHSLSSEEGECSQIGRSFQPPPPAPNCGSG